MTISNRRARKHTTAPQWKDRDLEWAHQAKGWLENAVSEFFTAHEDSEHTVSDVLNWIDLRNGLPTPYVRFLGDYEIRYGWVGSILERFAKAHILDLGATVNARGRDAKCYRKATRGYRVTAVGPHAEVVKKTIEAWLKSQGGSLKLDKLEIEREGSYESEAPAASGGEKEE